MADTIIGGDHGKCHDCGQDHAHVVHWGPPVPDGRRTILCGKCMQTRNRWSRSHKDPLPVPMPREVLAGEVMET